MSKEELVDLIMQPFEMGHDGTIDDRIALIKLRQWYETFDRDNLLRLYLSVRSTQFTYNDRYGSVLHIN